MNLFIILLLLFSSSLQDPIIEHNSRNIEFKVVKIPPELSYLTDLGSNDQIKIVLKPKNGTFTKEISQSELNQLIKSALMDRRRKLIGSRPRYG